MECDCPIVESSPVCFADGAQVAINACEAVMCLGLPVDSFSEEWCGEDASWLEKRPRPCHSLRTRGLGMPLGASQ